MKKTIIIIIVTVIITLILTIAINAIQKQKQPEETQNKVEETKQNIQAILKGGITNSTGTIITQDVVDYINNNIILEKAIVDKFETYYNTKVWGLSNIKIKNNGDKSIAKVTITIYFKDVEGKTIGENNINIGISNAYNTVSALKPNYEWSSEKDYYYELKNLSDTIDPTRNEIKITNIIFE